MTDRSPDWTIPAGATEVRARGDEATILGLFRGVTVFRALALVWALVGVASSTEFLRRPWLAALLVTTMVGWTVAVSLWPGRGPLLPVLAPWVIGAELALGAVIQVGDGFVYEQGRVISLSWSWPAAGVMAAGIVFGWRAGLGAAVAMVAANLATEFRFDTNVTQPVQAFSRTGLWVATGLLAGYVSSRLRRAEAEVAMVRAREEVARQLHDGVLQTLAVIQRRSDDADLALLAREQEADLRRYLSGSADRPTALEPELRRLAAHHEAHHPPTRVRVVVAPDAPEPTPDRLAAVVGAVGEALTNVAKHAQASTVTLFAEPADPDDTPRPARLFVSVKDDGVGFDPTAVTERIGLARSVRGRVHEVGGTTEILGRPGRGAEVKIWV